MSADFHQVAQMMRGMIVSMSLAVDDVAAGRYDAAEREFLAGGLDRVAAALRAGGGLRDVRVVESERVDS
ncbi:hypothetical protein ABT324_17910 [Saccharopolyspora sp. NPDC000359]|uniref:hypothetical protein n=1 Tax=Saccharopolyspora sp. NPDC000359 TaxID=3154251 RepID=UPI00332FD6C5